MADRIVHIAASGGDYTSFAAAVAGEPGFQVGEDNIQFIRTDAVMETNMVDIASGYTTSSAHKLIFTSSTEAKHDGTRGSGAGVSTGVHYSCAFQPQLNYIEIIGLELTASEHNCTGVTMYGNYNKVIDCLIYDLDASDCVGVNIEGGLGVVVNTIVENCYHGIQGTPYGGAYATVYNCTVLNSTVYGISNLRSSATQYGKNNYAGGSGTADYYNAGTMDLTTCASSDGTGSTTEIEVVDCAFTNVTAGSENAHIGSTSDLIAAGTDLRADATYNVTLDFEGDTRPATPAIGADEYVAAGGRVTFNTRPNHLGEQIGMGFGMNLN